MPVAELAVRWSAPEARRPYARPFGVMFSGDGEAAGALAVSGADLIYYRQFQAAVLTHLGELFIHPTVEVAPDAQRAWLEVVAGRLPALELEHLEPVSDFDDEHGRRHRLSPGLPGAPWVSLAPSDALEYQDVQASLAHQTGRLYRLPGVEAVEDAEERRRAWVAELRRLVRRPEGALAPWPFA